MAPTSLCLSLLVASCRLGMLVSAQEQQVQFNQVINLNGDMTLNSLKFPDGSRIETFNQVQKQMIVNQNPNPLSANHVVGSTGQPFVQLSAQSMTIQTNKATDLVGAQIEMAMDPNMMQQMNVSPDNAFVAKLSSDRQAWIVMEEIKNVNITDNTVRMIKMTSLDGEYMAVGRQTSETGQVVTPFNANQLVQISGSGIQEVEWTDGFRMSVKSSQPMTIKTDVVNGVSTSMTTGGIMSVNNYRYKVTSNLAGVTTDLNNMVAVVQMPINAERVMSMAASMGATANSAISLGVAQRVVLGNPGGSSVQPLNKKKRQDTSSSTTSSDTQSSTTTAADSASTSNTDQQQNGATTTSASLQGGAGSPQATQLLLAPTFSPLTGQPQLDMLNNRLAVPVRAVDGEFILTMGMAGSQGTIEVNPGTNTGSGSTTSPSRAPSAELPGTPANEPAGQRPAAGEPSQRPAGERPAAGEPTQQPANALEPAGARPAGAQEPAGARPAGALEPAGARPAAAEPSGAPATLAPVKRQASTGAAPGTVVMTMAQLAEMAQRQANGGVVPVWTMMTQFAQQEIARGQAPSVKRRDIKDRRAVLFKV